MCSARDAALRRAIAARREEHLAQTAQLRQELEKQARVAIAARRDEIQRVQDAAHRRMELDLDRRAAQAADAARAERERQGREAAALRHNDSEDTRKRAAVADKFRSAHRPVSSPAAGTSGAIQGAAAAVRRLDAMEAAERARLLARLSAECSALLQEAEARWRRRI